MVKVGVAGCGWWATMAHLPGIVEHPEAELVAVVDPSEAKREEAARRFGAPHAYASVEELLANHELDALVVASSPAHHFEPAAAALARGVNVLVEKPMTVRADEARELVRLARENDCELAVGYTWHFSPHVAELREAIARGRIGRIEHVSSSFASITRDLFRGEPERLREVLGFPSVAPDAATYGDARVSGGGQVQAQLTHNLALVLHLTGLRVRRLAAFLASFELPVDLADSVALEFEGGAVGAIDSAGSLQPGQLESLSCRVLGNEGHVELDVTKGTASIHGPGGKVEELERVAAGEADREKVDNLVLYPEKAPVLNLIDLTLGRAENVNPGTLGCHVVEVIDAIYESARWGQVVTLERAAVA